MAPRRAVSGSARATYAGTSATSGAVGTTNGQVMSAPARPGVAARCRRRSRLAGPGGPHRAGSCRGPRRRSPAGAVAPWLGRRGPAPGRVGERHRHHRHERDGHRQQRRLREQRPGPTAERRTPTITARTATPERVPPTDQAGDRSTCGQPTPPDPQQEQRAERRCRDREGQFDRVRHRRALGDQRQQQRAPPRRAHCRCGSRSTPSKRRPSRSWPSTPLMETTSPDEWTGTPRRHRPPAGR